MKCCFPKKLRNRSKREDVYKVAEEPTEKPKSEEAAATEPQFSWDKRENVDLSQFVVSDVHGDVQKRVGNNKDSMQIENCTEASIFLLKPTDSITIDDCRDCLLILGPCSGSVFIRDCSNCYILSACQQLRTRDCHDIHLGLLCATQPIIENSFDMHFYPLALNYEDFKNQMREVALSVRTNRIRSIHDFTPGRKNFSVHANFMEIKPEYMGLLEMNGISVDKKDSIIPIFNSSAVEDKPTRYIYSIQAADESSEDFCERGITFASLLKSSSLALISTSDINAKKVEKTMLPMAGNFENFMVFGVSGDEAEMKKICKENFDLFILLEDDRTAQMEALINAFNSNE